MKDGDNKKFHQTKNVARLAEFNSTWMMQILGNYFQDNETALNLGLDNLALTVYEVLSSQRTDEELQNEVLFFER